MLPQSTFFIHIEPSEDPASFADQSLDRGGTDDERNWGEKRGGPIGPPLFSLGRLD